MLKTAGTLTHTRSELSTTENPVWSLLCNSVKHCDKTSKNDQLSPALAIMSLTIYEKRQSIQTCLLQYNTVIVSKKSTRLTNYCYQTSITNRYSLNKQHPAISKKIVLLQPMIKFKISVSKFKDWKLCIYSHSLSSLKVSSDETSKVNK